MSRRSAARNPDSRSESSSITRRQALTRVALGAAVVGTGSVAWPETALAAATLVEAQCRLVGNGRALAARFSIAGLDPSGGDVTARISVEDCNGTTLHEVEAIVGFEAPPEVINTADSHYLADLDPSGDLRAHLVWRNVVLGAGGLVVRLRLEQDDPDHPVFNGICPVEGSGPPCPAPTVSPGF